MSQRVLAARGERLVDDEEDEEKEQDAPVRRADALEPLHVEVDRRRGVLGHAALRERVEDERVLGRIATVEERLEDGQGRRVVHDASGDLDGERVLRTVRDLVGPGVERGGRGRRKLGDGEGLLDCERERDPSQP